MGGRLVVDQNPEVKSWWTNELHIGYERRARGRRDKWVLDRLFPLLCRYQLPLIRGCQLGHSYPHSTFTPRRRWRGKGKSWPKLWVRMNRRIMKHWKIEISEPSSKPLLSLSEAPTRRANLTAMWLWFLWLFLLPNTHDSQFCTTKHIRIQQCGF